MKPIRLEVKGLYSYREAAVIDFESLTQSGLFGIFGPVGSGKSAILEAITFALYGETARMSQLERSYNMMNLQSDELFIDYQFQVRGIIYRFTASSTRNSRNFNDIRNLRRSAYQKTEGGWVPLEKGATESAETIIGLNYKNFRRTIIIPQGKFQEFLQLTRKDRTTMLEELFNLERFNLQSRTASLTKETQLLLSRQEGQMEQMAGVTGERVATLDSELIQLEKEQDGRRERLAGLEAKEKEYSRMGLLYRELESVRSGLKDAEKDVELCDLREAELVRREDAVRIFSLPMERLKELRLEAGARRNEEGGLLKEEMELKAKYTRWESERNDFLKNYSRRDENVKTGEGLVRLVHLLDKEDEIREHVLRKDVLDGKIRGLGIREADCRLKFERLKSDIASDRSSLPSSSERMALQRWMDERGRFLKELEQRRDSLKLIETEIGEVEVKRNLLVSASLFADSLGIDPEQEDIADAENKLREKRRISLGETADKEVRQRLIVLADNLTPGEACPLCGSAEHPSPAAADTFDKGSISDEGAESESDDFEGTWELFGRLKTELLIILSRIKSGRTRAEELASEILSLEREEEQHRSGFRWQGFASADISRDQEVLDSFSRKEKSLEFKAAELEELEDELETLRKESSLLGAEGVSAGENLAGVSAVAASLRLELTDEFLNRWKGFSKEELLSESKEIKDLLEKQEEERELVEAGGKELERLLDSSSHKLEFNSELLDKLSVKIGENEKALDTLLSGSSFVSIKQVEDILAVDIPIKEERHRIRKIREGVLELQTRSRSLENEIGGFVFLEKEYESLVDEIKSIRIEWEESSRKIGEVAEGLRELRDQLEVKKKLEADIGIQRAREDNLKKLGSLFKARGFVGYVSTLYLRELVAGANVRFEKLCHQSMKLELNEDNSFAVRDFLNGGKVRSVKTLSGGQTFQAAFSLALALADSVNSGNSQTGEEGFFFLDEGFGSLDRDSLRIVMEALWSLGRENRVVGVISHVEEMREEIPSCLIVSRDEERGSSIAPG